MNVSGYINLIKRKFTIHS